MSKIYKRKTVPEVVKRVFVNRYKNESGITFDWYCYKKDKYEPMSDENRVYGCFVNKDGELYSYILQGNIHKFEELDRQDKEEEIKNITQELI